MEISNDTLNKAAEEIKALFESYQPKISKAFDKCGGAVTVNTSLKFTQEVNATILEVGISFVESKIMEKYKFKIDPNQLDLFPLDKF